MGGGRRCSYYSSQASVLAPQPRGWSGSHTACPAGAGSGSPGTSRSAACTRTQGCQSAAAWAAAKPRYQWPASGSKALSQAAPACRGTAALESQRRRCTAQLFIRHQMNWLLCPAYSIPIIKWDLICSKQYIIVVIITPQFWKIQGRLIHFEFITIGL